MAGKKKFRKLRRRKAGIAFWLIFLMLIGAYIAVLEYRRPHLPGQPLRYDEFFDLVNEGRVVKARILDRDAAVIGVFEEFDGRRRAFHAKFFRSENVREGLLGLLVSNGVRIQIDQQDAKGVADAMLVLIPGLLLVAALIYVLLSMRSGSGMFFSRSGASIHEPGEGVARFTDVAGQDKAVKELSEVSEFLQDPDRFAALGARVPKGVLVFGPPGCGKTLIARALAGESGATFMSISGADFIEMFVGSGASKVRELFREARENAPTIMFIDEIDSIGKRRSSGPNVGSQDEQEQALNQLLAEMDGFRPTQGVIVLAATNRPDVLDPALLRPGRFDRTVGLDRPDEHGRLAILEVHARGKPLGPDADLAAVASKGIGLSGADIANLINEAALLSARAAKSAIGQDELLEAMERVIEAPERQRRLSMRDRSLGARAIGSERVTFADVAGIDEALVELREVKTYLDNPQLFADLGARPPRGFLLVGPPGCGKTLLARAVAGEANAMFISVAATEFTEIFVGEGAGRVRDLFAEARSAPPAIVFIDEIDAIGARRSGGGMDGHREREQTLNQILIELDGFGPRDGVIVMAASNRPEILDPALVRPGRFDRTITINLPDRFGRRQIIGVHAAGKPLGPDVDLDHMAAVTGGFSGADIANVMNEAALLAARQQSHVITMRLIEEAMDRVSMGVTRPYVFKDDERFATAYHEAGHSLLSFALPGADPPGRVSIIPRGTTMGAAWSISDERGSYTRAALVDRMAVLLGGWVAEDLVVGEPSTGAWGDLDKVGRLARTMVLKYGMSEALGTVSYAQGNGSVDDDLAWTPSEETARLIDLEVKRVVDEARGLARITLTRLRPALDRIAKELLDKEALNADEIAAIAGLARAQRSQRSARPVA